MIFHIFRIVCIGQSKPVLIIHLQLLFVMVGSATTTTTTAGLNANFNPVDDEAESNFSHHFILVNQNRS